ncbi:MAG: acyl-CoA synthetase FdrA [Tessaracoccus sp.]|uniref:acyl-CoA synthetase FdrA n=1 Tax=Tessaracoccus sp. TaxID=1971211 RepID=UPI001EC9F05B|nr:acyl-CoA synthetase FdrA [Tessaracoccus sp.]MBK7821008.1 acyl-CoA synthetase FdrA [Tessaracoccus sp.]
MPTRTLIKKNTYIDSVSLMSISTKAAALEGVVNAVAAMATAMNKEILTNQGLITPEIEEATPGDLVLIVVTDGEEDAADAALEGLVGLLDRKPSGEAAEVTYRTIATAAAGRADANFAVISVNGAFAAGQAHNALDAGLNVMLFSDNVALEDEIALKRKAHEAGLLMMGPDCGTAIINGVSLCFANKVRRGRIGIVAASGTGAQEMSVRIHDFTGGVSQLIGTGGRDLSAEVGAIMMLDGIDALDADPATDVLVVISKPPASEVAEKVLDRLAASDKPAIVCFLGAGDEVAEAAKARGIAFFDRTKPAALAAVVASGVDESTLDLHPLNWPLIEEVRAKLNPEQRYIRALFCGGTLCDESMFLAMEKYDDVYSNLAKDPAKKLGGNDASRAHTFLDFGEDEFTNGKPHPMIDPSNRIERFAVEATDPEVGVIVLDFVLGYGANPDPVGVMLPAINAAKANAAAAGRHLEILAFVLGTAEDSQNFDDQVAKLAEAGVTWASSSTNTGLLAREFVYKGENA